MIRSVLWGLVVAALLIIAFHVAGCARIEAHYWQGYYEAKCFHGRPCE